MAITVPVVGTEISVANFGKPVAETVNMLGKTWFVQTAGVNNIVTTSAAYQRVWYQTIVIAGSDIVPGLCAVLFACTYVPVYANFGYGLMNGWDNVAVGTGVGGSTGVTAMGPTAFAVSPAITVAGNHTMEIWFSGQPNGTYNIGGTAMMASLAVRQ